MEVRDVDERCGVARCGQWASTRCVRCGRPLCAGHVVESYSYRPGGQRPFCPDCDAARERIYQSMRTQGLRAIVWSGAGAVIGSVVGHTVGDLISTNSFTHTFATDLGFLAGLGLALFGALSWANRGTPAPAEASTGDEPSPRT
jgi:hypothetical protein